MIKPMKLVIAVMVLLFFVLQYELWFANGGVISAMKLKHHIVNQQAVNQKLKQRNQALIADIKDLKKGEQAVEERARSNLGMVKKGEMFYQVVKR